VRLISLIAHTHVVSMYSLEYALLRLGGGGGEQQQQEQQQQQQQQHS
jgi:hypothetical protein